jgi:WD40 repeat protein
VAHAHGAPVRHADYNPTRQHQLATAGDDGRVKVWDLRHTGRALVEFEPHAHWVCQVRFNPTYDRLLLVRPQPTPLPPPYSDAKVANRNGRVWHGATENGP